MLKRERHSFGLHCGVAIRRHTQLEHADHPVQRLAVAVVAEKRDFEVAVADAVGGWNRAVR
jgi:hypothetical protein